jgi:hypothetical protein
MKYREHRGGLTESMETVVEIEGADDLMRIINAGRAQWYQPAITIDQLAVEPYGYDGRIDWDTHIVTVDGAAVGFTDGPIQTKDMGK